MPWTWTTRRARHVLVAGALACLAGSVATVAGAQGVDEEAAAEAAREIAAAQDRANEAAAAFFQAQSDLEVLEDRAARLEREQDELQAEVDALRLQVEDVAITRFMASGSLGIPLLTGYQRPSDQLQADVLSSVINETSADSIDEFELAQDRLDAKAQEVDSTHAQVEAQQAEFARLRDDAQAEVANLQEVEAQRLEDEQVRIALEAQRREEEQRRQEEAERRAAEEAAKATTTTSPTGVTTPAPPSDDQDPGGSPSPDPLPEPPTPSPGDDTPPPPAPPPPPTGNGIICPVDGSSAYSDTYGAPRSGGRSHEGVDMLAPSGTPLVAVVSGFAEFKQNPLGGNAVWINGADGNRYYYAHLSAFEGSSRDVSQGERIGYVGDTGNAAGTPHLHFEVHPGGGASVNPTPWVRAAGC